MPWTPPQNVLDYEQIIENFFVYVQSASEDALAWANDNQNPPLVPFKEFHKSAAGRLVTVFPSLMLIRFDGAQSFEDLIDGKLVISLEATMEGGDSEKLVREARRYEMALSSMILNCPKTTWTNNSKIDLVADVDSIETAFDVIAQNLNSAFIQVFNTRFTLNLRGAAYG